MYTGIHGPLLQAKQTKTLKRASKLHDSSAHHPHPLFLTNDHHRNTSALILLLTRYQTSFRANHHKYTHSSLPCIHTCLLSSLPLQLPLQYYIFPAHFPAKFTKTATSINPHNTFGPHFSWNPTGLLNSIILTLYKYSPAAYIKLATAVTVNPNAAYKSAFLPPSCVVVKFNNVVAMAEIMILNSNHERNVLSAAKCTFGSILIGTNIFLPGGARKGRW